MNLIQKIRFNGILTQAGSYCLSTHLIELLCRHSRSHSNTTGNLQYILEVVIVMFNQIRPSSKPAEVKEESDKDRKSLPVNSDKYHGYTPGLVETHCEKNVTLHPE
jgi:hypothetical protein